MKKLFFLILYLSFGFAQSNLKWEDPFFQKYHKYIQGQPKPLVWGFRWYKDYAKTTYTQKYENGEWVVTFRVYKNDQFFQGECKSYMGTTSEDSYMDEAIKKSSIRSECIANPEKNLKPYSGPISDYYEGGKLRIEGTYKDGKLDGPYTVYMGITDDGELKLEILFKSNKIIKTPTYYLDGQLINGSQVFYKYGKIEVEGTFKDGKQDGLFEYYIDGRFFLEQTYKAGEPDGPYKFYYSNGQLEEEGNFNNVELDSPVKYYYRNGQLKREGTLNNGKLNGPYKSYYENGQLWKEGNFKNDLVEGPFKSYYKDGPLESEGYYLSNLQQRKWTYYFEDGQLRGIGSYKDGDGTSHGNTGIPKHGRIGTWKFFHKNGKLKSESTWKDGERDGPYKSYYENGQLKEEGTLKDGELDGPTKTYYQNGQLKSEITWKDGELDGPTKTYYQNGQLKRETTYQFGQKIKERKYKNVE